MNDKGVHTVSKSEMIIKLLEEGKTYAQIQADLGVSPSKISEVKKRFQSENKATEDIETNNELNEVSATIKEENNDSSTINNLKTSTMKNENSNSTDTEVLLKIKKMEQDHEVVMKELELAKLEMENKLLEINTTPDEVVLELQSRINDLEIENADLESDIEDLSYQVDELEDHATQNYHVEEDEVEENSEEEAEENEEVEQHYFDSDGDLSEDYFGALIDFFARIIEADGSKLNENEITEIIETSKKYMKIFDRWLNDDDGNQKDYAEPNLLYLIKAEMKSLNKKLAKKGKEKIRMKFNEEVVDLLDAYLEGE
jgi:hypothetical protein